MNISVLRLSHRLVRDKRMSTHLALVSRALGITEFYYSGEHDSSVEKSVIQVCNEWGGNFSIIHVENPLKFTKEWKKKGGKIVHLTMYGIELSEILEELKKQFEKDILVIVGGAKVSGSIFELADYNVAIGHQPHSEIAALAIFLDNITEGKARKLKFQESKIEIIPTKKGKRTKYL
ncbi:MAG: tRNA (cytidine(56)-2'-O)-methyltransferase [Candidatus Heimdallarchaeaceae archaeon]